MSDNILNVRGWLAVENGMIVLHETTETIKDKSKLRYLLVINPDKILVLVKIDPSDSLELVE